MPEWTSISSHKSLRHLIGASVFVLIAITWGAVEFGLHMERQRDIAATRSTTENLSFALREHMSGILKQVDRTLLLTRDHLGATMSQDSLRHILTHPALGDSIIDLLIFIDRDGFVAASSIPLGNGRVYVGDREHIGNHLAGGEDVPIVGKPVISRVALRWSLPMTRKVYASDGSIAGVLVAAFSPKKLSDLYKQFDLGPSGQVSLIGFDGVYRARGARQDLGVGGTLLDRSLLDLAKEHRHGSAIIAGQDSTASRIYGYHVADPYPLVVTASISEDDALKDFYANARNARAVAFILSVITIALGFVVLYHRRRLYGIISALRRSEAIAERKSRELSTTLEHMSRGIMMVDHAGVVRILNRRVIEMFDLPERFLGYAPSFKEVVNFLVERGEFGEHFAEGDSAVLQAIDFAQSCTRSFVYQRQRKNGTVIEVHNKPIPDGGFIRTFTDMTDVKRHQEALEVGARNLDRFSHIAMRDLQEPMHEISSELLRLSKAVNQKDSLAANRSIHILSAAAGRSRAIANELVRYSQYCVQSHETSPAHIDELVQQAALRVQEQAPAGTFLISSTLTPQLVACDSVLMSSVFEGLFNYAALLRHKGQPIEIQVYGYVDAQTEQFHLHVRDNSMGFSPKEAERIFEPFTRLTSASTPIEFGIGLAIVHSIVEKHGWMIKASSIVDVGSVFTLSIPKRDLVALVSTKSEPDTHSVAA